MPRQALRLSGVTLRVTSRRSECPFIAPRPRFRPAVARPGYRRVAAGSAAGQYGPPAEYGGLSAGVPADPVLSHRRSPCLSGARLSGPLPRVAARPFRTPFLSPPARAVRPNAPHPSRLTAENSIEALRFLSDVAPPQGGRSGPGRICRKRYASLHEDGSGPDATGYARADQPSAVKPLWNIRWPRASSEHAKMPGRVSRRPTSPPHCSLTPSTLHPPPCAVLRASPFTPQSRRRFKGPAGSPPFVPTRPRRRPLRASRPRRIARNRRCRHRMAVRSSPPRHGSNRTGSYIAHEPAGTTRAAYGGIRHPGLGFPQRRQSVRPFQAPKERTRLRLEAPTAKVLAGLARVAPVTAIGPGSKFRPARCRRLSRPLHSAQALRRGVATKAAVMRHASVPPQRVPPEVPSAVASARRITRAFATTPRAARQESGEPPCALSPPSGWARWPGGGALVPHTSTSRHGSASLTRSSNSPLAPYAPRRGRRAGFASGAPSTRARAPAKRGRGGPRTPSRANAFGVPAEYAAPPSHTSTVNRFSKCHR